MSLFNPFSSSGSPAERVAPNPALSAAVVSPTQSMASSNPTSTERAASGLAHSGVQQSRFKAHTQARGLHVHGLSLCNDVVFKALVSRHPHLLSDLINAVRHPAAPITVQRILNPTILPQDLEGKHIVLDILAEDVDGQRLGIEMQLQPFRHWPQRNVYGVARSLAGQLKAGQGYRDLKPAIGISLLAHDLFTQYPAKANWHFTLRDSQYPQIQLDQVLQVHIIELHKAEALRELPEPLLAWTACLLNNLDEGAMNAITHPPVQEALTHLQTLYSNEELRLMAERREQALVDAEDMLDQARYDGEQKGQAQLLARQLEHKFGPLSSYYQAQLSRASADQLHNWSLSLLDARCIESVFI
ncbi:Rpn family recombination-promoting nuclease/putative transposase [Pusillimonas sp. ANT_WB101]|uniref:Rpn family recombination-promoting nuclease/putative transposase n=1 Tax=Pusillimonas sp. ANT_WB101 TaxID=2597356 RepID=UPI0011ECD664|nr:Rpn family recombination-promoting nuclease/putative transposase [Pusillimonas sp. ANT_WB101]KAA0888646.1 Rpn family recombination-promoting nuclease/putative transposase [Pusillimonas sp. ANT_WB101]